MHAPDQRVFLATTPYHILLACALADEAHDDESHLIVLPNFADPAAMLDALRESGIFASVTELPKLKPMTFRELRASLALMRQCVDPFPRLHRFYIFHDRNQFMQAALHRVRKLHPDARISYVEDGTAAYSSFLLGPDRLGTTTLVNKLLYGAWSQHIRCFGTSKWIDDVCAILPEYLRPELRHHPMHRIDRDRFIHCATTDWTSRYLRCQGAAPEELQDFDLLFIALHSGARNIGRYPDIVRRFLAEAAQRGLRVAMKYHPNEPAGDYLGAGQLNGCTILPNEIPAEFIVLRSAKRLALIIGDISTSLLTARWLLPQSTVVSLARFMETQDDVLLDVFHRLGIEIPTDLEETFDRCLRATATE